MGYISEMRRSVGCAPLFMPGAGVFFVDAENRALLQRRRDNGLWAGTGGSMELGETFEQTVRREAVEEVGLYPVSLERLNVYSGESQHYTYPNGDEVYVVSVAFVSTVFEGKLRVDPEECLEARFFALSEFPEEAMTHPPDRPMLEDLKQWMRTKR
jgi:8-oxo-dGTP pyrophosphatase MutT (NUDIX family)